MIMGLQPAELRQLFRNRGIQGLLQHSNQTKGPKPLYCIQHSQPTPLTALASAIAGSIITADAASTTAGATGVAHAPTPAAQQAPPVLHERKHLPGRLSRC